MAENESDQEEVTIEEALAYAVEHHQAGSLQEAAIVYERILDAEPDHAPTLSYLGLYRYQTGWPEEAEKLLRKAVTIQPDYVDGHFNLGNVLVQVEKIEEALAAFRRVMELSPTHSGALTNMGDLLFRADRFPEAIEEYRKAIEIDAGNSRALRNLARIYYRQRDLDSAKAIYRGWLAMDPESATARHLLPGLGEGEVPERAADAYVIEEFDDFAETFEKTLGKLEYRGPELCRDALAELVPTPAGDLTILDAGCGTGLLGALLRPYANHLVGVDLSPKMLERANGRKIYDELFQAELTAFLEAAGPFHVVGAADTLIYFGRLDPLLTAIAHALTPAGHFVFTVEAGKPDESFVLGPHGRYRHGEAWLVSQLNEAGLEVVSLAPATIRKERSTHVPGLVVAATR